jgi:hypothetical protein
VGKLKADSNPDLGIVGGQAILEGDEAIEGRSGEAIASQFLPKLGRRER